jgi:hypothetical protein
MYNQFCKNLNNYMNIISDNDEYPNARKKIAETILPLADIKLYLENKQKNILYHKSVSNLIYSLSKYSAVYPSISKLIWELWAYGFDIESAPELESEGNNLDEAAKLVDLMLSTHYFA